MNVKKSIKKLFADPTEMRIQEVINILEFFEYSLCRVSGSHYQFTKLGKQIITIAVHQNKVVKFYLRIVKRAIMKEIIIPTL